MGPTDDKYISIDSSYHLQCEYKTAITYRTNIKGLLKIKLIYNGQPKINHVNGLKNCHFFDMFFELYTL